MKSIITPYEANEIVYSDDFKLPYSYKEMCFIIKRYASDKELDFKVERELVPRSVYRKLLKDGFTIYDEIRDNKTHITISWEEESYTEEDYYAAPDVLLTWEADNGIRY